MIAIFNLLLVAHKPNKTNASKHNKEQRTNWKKKIDTLIVLRGGCGGSVREGYISSLHKLSCSRLAELQPATVAWRDEDHYWSSMGTLLRSMQEHESMIQTDLNKEVVLLASATTILWNSMIGKTNHSNDVYHTLFPWCAISCRINRLQY